MGTRSVAEEEMESIRSLIAGVAIMEIRLKETSARTRIKSLDAIPEDGRLMVGVSATGAWEGDASGLLGVVASFEAKLVGEEESSPFVSVAATYEVTYKANLESPPSEEQIQLFAETNGVFNCWPYFRELTQSATTRMGLPALVLPLFRVKPAQKQDPNVQAAK